MESFFLCKTYPNIFINYQLPDTQFACDTVAKDSGTIITNKRKQMLCSSIPHKFQISLTKINDKIYKTNGHAEHLTSSVLLVLRM